MQWSRHKQIPRHTHLRIFRDTKNVEIGRDDEIVSYNPEIIQDFHIQVLFSLHIMSIEKSYTEK